MLEDAARRAAIAAADLRTIAGNYDARLGPLRPRCIHFLSTCRRGVRRTLHDRPERAEVRFSYSIALSSGIGRFTSVKGTADIDDAALDKTTVEALIDTRTLRTSDQMWQGELRGADFFDVAKYPQMRFKSTSVRPKNATTGEMTGNMTIKSVTRPIVLHVTLQPPGPGGRAHSAPRRASTATTSI